MICNTEGWLKISISKLNLELDTGLFCFWGGWGRMKYSGRDKKIYWILIFGKSILRCLTEYIERLLLR